MSLFGGLGLIVVKKRDQENGKNDLEGLLPWLPWKALQIASMTNGGRDSVKEGSH